MGGLLDAVDEGTMDLRLGTVGDEVALEVGVARSVLMAAGGAFRVTGVLLGRVAEGTVEVLVAVLVLLAVDVGEVRVAGFELTGSAPGLMPSSERIDFLFTEEARPTVVEAFSVIVGGLQGGKKEKEKRREGERHN